MAMFFDSSTLISMAVTCSLPVLRSLKKAYKDNFYITSAVYQETIDRAMHSLRFRYEGHRLKELVDDNVIKIYPDKMLTGKINDLMSNVNRTYFAWNRPLNIVQLGEMSAMIAAIEENAEFIALDERTARLLIENPEGLKPWLEHKLHTSVKMDERRLKDWSGCVFGKFMPLRSAEFALMAWEKGILGDDRDVLFGLLWALKFAGCAIAEQEINYYMQKYA